jgi:EpsI family protein
VLVWSAAWVAGIQVVQALALVPLVLSVLWAVTGSGIARRLLLPVLFITLAIPVWSPLLPILQHITAESAFWLTRVSGIPALLQDYTIHLPSGRLHVRDACSGLHYLLAGVTLGIFYAWLNYRQLWHRLLVVIVAAGAAIAANVLRVFIITWLAHSTEMQHPYVKDHLSLGWYLFGGLVFLLLVIDLLFTRHDAAGETRPVAAGGAGCRYDDRRRYAVYLASAALIAAGPLAAAWLTTGVQSAYVQALQLPRGASGWQGPAIVSDSWQPVYRGAIPLRGVYNKDGETIHLYVGYYPRQGQGVELINELNRIANPDSWQVSRSVTIDPEQAEHGVIEAELDSLYTGRRLVWYRYRVAGHYTTSPYVAKLLQIAGLLSGKADASIIAVATDMHNDARDARERLADFMFSMEKPLTRIADGNN